MKSKITSCIVLSTFVSLIAFLFVGSANNGAEDYAKIEKMSRDLSQVDTELDTAVLSMQLGLVADYDEIKQGERQLDEYLSTQPFDFTSEEFTCDLIPLVKKKAVLIGDFKSSHSISRIALAGFRHHARNALSDVSQTSSPFVRSVVNLEILGSRFVASGSVDDMQAFQKAITDTEKARAQSTQSEFKTNSLDMALKHAKLLINRRSQLNQVIESLISIPIEQYTIQALDRAAQKFDRQAKQARLFQVFLSLAIVILIGFSIYQYLMLYKSRAALAHANRNLENRVLERTAELANANQLLNTAKGNAEKLALVARYTDNAVVITNEKSEIEWVNEGFERITSYQSQDVIGKPFIEPLYRADIDNNQMEAVQRAIQDQKAFDVEMLSSRKDGTPIFVAIEARPIKNSEGVFSKFILIANDITDRVNAESERQKLNEQLLEASRAAGIAEVATGVLHNVGNVLNSVNVSASVIASQIRTSAFSKLELIADLTQQHAGNFSEFISDDPCGQKIPEFISKITNVLRTERSNVTDELDDLLNNVEHIKEIVAVQQDVAKSTGLFQSITASEVVESAIVAIKGTLANHNVAINIEIPDESQSFVSDKRKILQILINLITNAKDAIVGAGIPKPQIDISVDFVDDSLRINVQDNGPGIHPDDLNRIFQHGFTTKKTGHGFGLHSSANAATELGGSLNVVSEGDGRGALFQLTLPTNPACFENTKSKTMELCKPAF